MAERRVFGVCWLFFCFDRFVFVVVDAVRFCCATFTTPPKTTHPEAMAGRRGSAQLEIRELLHAVSSFLIHFTEFYWLLLGFTSGFDWIYWLLLGFDWIYWVLIGFTGLYWVLLGITRYYWVLIGFTRF